jgi:hypothetical protein
MPSASVFAQRMAPGLSAGQDIYMMTDRNAEAGNIGTLGLNARFGAAYLRAICSHAGVGFTETTIDEDVLAVDATVDFAISPARVQIKCSIRFKIKKGKTASWQAEESWWGKRISISKEQRLTASTLVAWADEVSSCFMP